MADHIIAQLSVLGVDVFASSVRKGATKFGRPLAVGTPVANDATTDAHARR